MPAPFHYHRCPPVTRFFLGRFLPVLCFILLGTGTAGAADYYVSTGGRIDGDGSVDDPWRTVEQALEPVGTGDTVYLRDGVYRERILVPSGIAIRAFPGESPVIDGSTLPVDDGWSPLIAIEDAHDVVVSGLELRGYQSDLPDRVPIGILVTGASGRITIENNLIHSLGTTYGGEEGGDAHGIAVYGTGAEPIQEIRIVGNHLHHLTLGSSEALVLNGNVTGFRIERNRIHDCNNIGIDLIGFEGTGPDVSIDQARDGVVSANEVYRIDASFNPAYGGDPVTGGGDLSAGGIYVDGGAEIIVERNRVYACNIGIEIASENAGRTTRNIVVRNNLIYNNAMGGIFIGGYDADRGGAEDCSILNNTLRYNDFHQFNGQIHVQHHVRRVSIRQNIFYVVPVQAFIVAPFGAVDADIDWNLYFLEGTSIPIWEWNGESAEFLDGWRQFGHDEHGLFTEPMLAPGSRPLTGSPAIDAGDPGFEPAPGELDFRGGPRGIDRVDLGAFEVDAAVAPTSGMPHLGRDGIVRVHFRRPASRVLVEESVDLTTWARVFTTESVFYLRDPDGWIIDDARPLTARRFYRVRQPDP